MRKRSRPFDFALGVDRRHGLADLVLARGREPLPSRRPIEADGIEPITPHLHADGALGVSLEDMTQPPVGDSPARGHAALGLLELIAVLRVVEEIGEVRKQVQAVVQQEAGCPQRRGALRLLILGGEALAVRLPSIAGIEKTETRDEALGDGAFRDLVGRIPVRPIAHASQREPVAIVAAAVPQDAIDLAVIVRTHPRAVVVVDLECAKQIPATNVRRGCSEQAAPPVVPPTGADDGALELIHVVDVRRARRRKISFVGEVRSLLELHATHELGNEKADVRITVRMRTRRRIDRNPGDHGREVGSVIQVEAAQVVLIRFALAAVLAHDETWHGFKDFARAHDRTLVDLRGGHGALARRCRNADEVRRRVLDIGDVAKCSCSRDDDVGGDRERQHDVHVHRTAVRDVDRPSQHAEVQEAKRELARGPVAPPRIGRLRRRPSLPSARVNRRPDRS